jgi:hypothetical protein
MIVETPDYRDMIAEQGCKHYATDKESNIVKLTKVMKDIGKAANPNPSRRTSLPETL